MKIHPTIEKLINQLKNAEINAFGKSDKKVLEVLKTAGATQTEAIITMHFYFGITLGDAEKLVYPSGVWNPEPLNDIAYQTFLYMNYDPADPNYSYDNEKVKISLLPKDKK